MIKWQDVYYVLNTELSNNSSSYYSVQLLSHFRLFETPWTAARQAFLSITNSWSLFKLMSIKSVMPCNHLILCHPLLLLPSGSFPASGSFPVTQFFTSGGQSIGVSASASVLQFSSVQFSCSVVSDSLRPYELQHARPPCPSPTPRVHSDSHPSSQWYHPAISSSVVPFSSCPQSFPASGSFPMSQFFISGGQSIGVSASASVLPIQDWFPLGWTGWIKRDLRMRFL